MVASKATHFTIQRKPLVVIEVARNPPPPRGTNNQVLNLTPSIPPPPSLIQHRPDPEVYQLPSFVKTAQQFHLGKFFFRPLCYRLV